MTGPEIEETAGAQQSGMMPLITRLYPICRSITGDGVRSTLDILGDEIELERHEIPSGTEVFDWTMPPEWNIRDAYIADGSGRRLIDFHEHNLHVLNYSTPIDTVMSRRSLAAHVYTLPQHPDWIPYRTSYYQKRWGFCLTHNQWQGIPDGDYRVYIDADLKPGALTLGEVLLPGESETEIVFSTHICHPSMCNDNLSGIAVLTRLFQWLSRRPRRYSYRALYVPGTIGSLSWLWLNRDRLDSVLGGLVLTGLGDPGGFTYKRSQQEDSCIDRLAALALADGGEDWQQRKFSPFGYDERQYCAPGFDLAVGRLSRTPFGEYSEYHTSADHLDFVSETQLHGALRVCQRFVEYLEADRCWVNLSPCGEPQLGKRGLYGALGGTGGPDEFRLAMLWMLNQADGSRPVSDVARRSGLSMELLAEAAETLAEAGLLAPADAPASERKQ